MNAPEILNQLRSLSNSKNAAGMARFGIHAKQVYGIPLPELKRLARQVGKDHLLAQELWSSGVHEARLFACFIDNPAEVTSREMDRWEVISTIGLCVTVVVCISSPKFHSLRRRWQPGVSEVKNLLNAQAFQ